MSGLSLSNNPFFTIPGSRSFGNNVTVQFSNGKVIIVGSDHEFDGELTIKRGASMVLTGDFPKMDVTVEAGATLQICGGALRNLTNCGTLRLG